MDIILAIKGLLSIQMGGQVYIDTVVPHKSGILVGYQFLHEGFGFVMVEDRITFFRPDGSKAFDFSV